MIQITPTSPNVTTIDAKLTRFIQQMPKAELHVHLEGSIQPSTLLQLAQRNHIPLPAHDEAGLQRWYQFTDFRHFIEIYLTISACLCTPEDIELIACDLLRQQAAQNIWYSEITYTPYTHFSTNRQIPFDEQLDALTRARTWAAQALGVQCNWVFDIARNVRPLEHALTVAEWASRAQSAGIVALGLGGIETNNPPELFVEAFAHARAAGLAAVPHAGEIAGADSVRGALDSLHATRIGHGVRCLEDPTLVALLRERQIPLEVCPTSNVCLGVANSFAEHPLPQLLAAGLFVTLNSDDPPMFNTTLTNEYLRAVTAFQLDAQQIEQLAMNAVHASLLPAAPKAALAEKFAAQFSQLHEQLSFG